MAGENPMQLIWPDEPSKIYVPKQMDGNRGMVVFEVAHQNPSQTIFWYVDDEFMGESTHIHKMSLNPAKGKHQLVLVDEDGNFLITKFEIVSKDEGR
jgi:penicillin-binding protein 1C